MRETCTVVKGGPTTGFSRSELVKEIADETLMLAGLQQKLASLPAADPAYISTRTNIKSLQSSLGELKRELAATPANPCPYYWTKTQLWTALQSVTELRLDGYRFHVLGPADSAPYPALTPLGQARRIGSARVWSGFKAEACLETSDGTELLASLVIRPRGPVRTGYPFSSMAIAADSQVINNFIDGAGECTY
jgi:hypothetical protein